MKSAACIILPFLLTTCLFAGDIMGTIVSNDKSFGADSFVYLLKEESLSVYNIVHSTHPDRNGYYRLSAIERGEYYLCISISELSSDSTSLKTSDAGENHSNLVKIVVHNRNTIYNWNLVKLENNRYQLKGK